MRRRGQQVEQVLELEIQEKIGVREEPPWDRPAPFIGHEGTGVRLTVSEGSTRTVVREHVGSQLAKSLGLLAYGPGGTAVIILKWNELGLLFPLLGFLSAIGWWFGLKFLAQLLGRRRIEVQRADGSVRLFVFGHRVAQEIRRTDIRSLGIETTYYRHEEYNERIANYSLVVQRVDGRRVELCISTEKQPVEAIAAMIGAPRVDCVPSLPGSSAPVARDSPLVEATPGGLVQSEKSARRKGCLIIVLAYLLVYAVYQALPRCAGETGRGTDGTEEGERRSAPR